eukprot:15366666-Ditylum_brightwellii.AAC.1
MGGTYLQFTTEVWYPPAQHQNHYEEDLPANNPDLQWVDLSDGKTTIIEKGSFPFLDMALSWDNDGKLQFGVYRKPKQALKYVDTDSTHRSIVFKSITNNMFARIARLPSKSGNFKNKRFDQV